MKAPLPLKVDFAPVSPAINEGRPRRTRCRIDGSRQRWAATHPTIQGSLLALLDRKAVKGHGPVCSTLFRLAEKRRRGQPPVFHLPLTS